MQWNINQEWDGDQMLILSKLTNTIWLVQYNTNVYRVRDGFIPKLGSRKNALSRIRHIVAKATKKNADKFKHVENRFVNGKWASYWIEV